LRVFPATRQGFKKELKEDESFESEFIGATVQECRDWLLGHQYQHNFVEQDLIAIVDARSATDGTILMSAYVRDLEGVILEFGEYGVLPRERDTWYDYRIAHEGADDLWSNLYFNSPGNVYPVYFDQKEALTDEHGVFDYVEANRLLDSGGCSDPPMQEE
jgi:hypothetical protein